MPIEIQRNGKPMGSIGSGGGSIENGGVRVWYGGDAYKTYAVQMGGLPVEDGTLNQEITMVSLGRRALPMLEAGRMDTAADSLSLRLSK